MPNSQILCRYTVPPAGGFTAAQLATLIQGPTVPIDFDLLAFYGLLLTNDLTSVVGGNAERDITLFMTPTVTPATATATLIGSQVASVTVGTPGGLYGAPPLIGFGGTPTYSAAAIPTMKLGGATIINGGTGYTGATTITLVGGLAPGGVQGVMTASIFGGAIGSVTVVSVGGPYERPPFVVVTDSGGGTGAYLAAGLSVLSIQVTSPGFGYSTAPAVTVTPAFKVSNPDSSNQKGAVRSFMKEVIEQMARVTLIAADPVVS